MWSVICDLLWYYCQKIMTYWSLWWLAFFSNKVLIEIKLIYNVELISGVQWSDSGMCVCVDMNLSKFEHSMDMNLSKLREIAKNREAWCAAVPGVAKSQIRLSDWTTTTFPLSQWCHPTISSFITPFSRPQSFAASRSFGHFQWVGSSHQVARVLELQLQC